MDSLSTQDRVDPEVDEDATSPMAEILRLWKSKQSAEPHFAPERGSLTLLKLPVDILRLILNEVSDQNRGDLSQLLLVNSTLHNLAASYIYSSFDIVWPDDSEIFPSMGVDALTHGLSTFALGNRFARTIHKLHGLKQPRHEELRNNYPLFTRSFSMANGPSKWVSDSIVTTEHGKMLNTLVAIAIQRMANLESFKWDMPTGLSSDVFMALASLDDQPNNHPCKLEQVWVRWHDSRATDGSSSTSGEFIDDPLLQPPPPPVPFPPEQPPSPPSSTAESIGSLNPNPLSTPYRRVPYHENEVEYPTFSVLPPLKSVTVLEIDQVAYLDELSFLIERSKPILKELRLSVAIKVKDEDFVQVKGNQHNLQQVDLEAQWPGESTIGDRRLGGVMGIILGRVYDLRKHWPRNSNNEPETSSSPIAVISTGLDIPAASGALVSNMDDELVAETIGSSSSAPIDDLSQNVVAEANKSTSAETSQAKKNVSTSQGQEDSDDRLPLELLELARIPIHPWLCAHAFDWTVLTSLTILQCPEQEKLWRALREQYRPTLVNTRPRRSSSRQPPKETWQYHLKLRNIHVDVTTFSLMNFLKETLAPNSLEVLFLQDRRRSTAPPVPLRNIFTGPIKRQHLSLKKLLLDSTHPDKVNNMGDPRRMFWALPLDLIEYITSGKMSNLRELSASVESSDLHTFLQRLPMMTNLTSLDMPSIGRGIGTVSSEEVGLQIVDVITLRPEIKLRFLGIRNVRYEVIESRRGSTTSDAESVVSDDAFSVSVSSGSHPPFSDVAVEDEDEILPSDNESDLESHTSRRATPDDASPRGHETEMATIYQLREIFPWDDIAIFKAKQGKL